MPDLLLAGRIVDFLNGCLALDRPAVAALIANRVPCGHALSVHPTVQVPQQHGGFHVGLLGLLNGLCGVYPDGSGPIAARFGTLVKDLEPGRSDGGPLDLLGFAVVERSAPAGDQAGEG